MQTKNINRKSFITPMRSMIMQPDSLTNTKVMIPSFSMLPIPPLIGPCMPYPRTWRNTGGDTMLAGRPATGETLPKTIGHGADRAEVETF